MDTLVPMALERPADGKVLLDLLFMLYNYCKLLNFQLMFLHFLSLSRNKVCTWGHTNEVDKKICTCIQMCWYIKPYSFILKLLWMFAIRDFFSNGLVAKPSQRGGWPIKSVGLDLTTYFSQSNCRFGAGTELTILEKKVSIQNYVHWRRPQFIDDDISLVTTFFPRISYRYAGTSCPRARWR